MEYDDILKLKEPCPKKVYFNKYEKGNPDIQEWWWKTFKILEDKSKTPFYKRKQHLEECFSKDTLKKLVNIGIEVQDVDDDIKLENFQEKPLVEVPSESKLQPRQTLSKKEPPKKFSNPYMNFMKRSKQKAQIWRPQPKPKIESVPLIKKAEMLENAIATEFNEWFSNVGSNAKSEIDANVILSIFEITMSYPVVTSICRRIFEIGSVPEVTANFLGFPEKSESACVQQQIIKDIEAGKLEPKYVAFNQTLPIELRRKPFTENLKAKWFEYQIMHKDLETMAVIWKDITELHTTRAFIQWLLNHPDISPPPFFKNEGLMSRKMLSKAYMDFVDFEDNEWLPIQGLQTKF